MEDLKIHKEKRKKHISRHPKSHYQLITIIICLLLLIAFALVYIVFFVYQYNPFEGFNFIPKDSISNKGPSSFGLKSITGTTSRDLE